MMMVMMMVMMVMMIHTALLGNGCDHLRSCDESEEMQSGGCFSVLFHCGLLLVLTPQLIQYDDPYTPVGPEIF